MHTNADLRDECARILEERGPMVIDNLFRIISDIMPGLRQRWSQPRIGLSQQLLQDYKRRFTIDEKTRRWRYVVREPKRSAAKESPRSISVGEPYVSLRDRVARRRALESKWVGLKPAVEIGIGTDDEGRRISAAVTILVPEKDRAAMSRTEPHISAAHDIRSGVLSVTVNNVDCPYRVEVAIPSTGEKKLSPGGEDYHRPRERAYFTVQVPVPKGATTARHD